MAVTISPEHRKLALPGLGQFCEDNQENLLSRNHEFQQKASGKVLEREISYGDDVKRH